MKRFKGKIIPEYITVSSNIHSGCVVTGSKCTGISHIFCKECVANLIYAKGITYDFLLRNGHITKEKRLEILLDRGI